MSTAKLTAAGRGQQTRQHEHGAIILIPSLDRFTSLSARTWRGVEYPMALDYRSPPSPLLGHSNPCVEVAFGDNIGS